MNAWRAYMDEAGKAVPEERTPQQNQLISIKHAAMIFQIMKTLGFKLSEGEIQTEAYLSKASAKREDLYVNTLIAIQHMAVSSKRSADLLERMIPQTSND